MIIKKLKRILFYISRVIYNIIPEEYKENYNLSYPYYRYNNEQIKKSYDHFQKYFINSTLFSSIDDIRSFALTRAFRNNPESEDYLALEFGVFKGKSAMFFSKKLKKQKLYGFDSFQGLNEDWLGRPDFKEGVFATDETDKHKWPKNIHLVKGTFQQTLKQFLNEKKSKINFVHIDIDTYESTKYVLENIKEYLLKGSIIIFDELYNNPGWEYSELKALNEVFKEDEFKYLAFNLKGEQAVIEIN